MNFDLSPFHLLKKNESSNFETMSFIDCSVNNNTQTYPGDPFCIMLYPQDLSLENNPSLSSDNVNLTLQIWDFYMGLATGGRIDDYPGIVVDGLSDEFDNGLLYNVLFYSGDFPPPITLKGN